MEIWHDIRFRSEDKIDDHLHEIGIKYRRVPRVNGQYNISFEIAESDERWGRIQELLRITGKPDSPYDTRFSDFEVQNAEWLRVWGVPQIGYPQPERRWQEEHFNYENKCPVCGSFRQVSAFFTKAEPKTRRYDFMSLYWTSALFAVPRVFAALEAHGINGYERWPVFIYKTKEPSATVSQLYIPAATAPTVVQAADLEPFTCAHCGALKYQRYHKRGITYLRREAIPTGVDLFETYEWFGEGHQPRREMIVSNRFVKLAYAEQWKGLNFKVAEAV